MRKRFVLCALLLAMPFVTMANVYQGLLTKSSDSCTHLYEISLQGCKKFTDQDIAVLRDLHQNISFGFQRPSVACEVLKYLPENAHVLQLDDMCTVPIGFSPFSSQMVKSKQDFLRVQSMLSKLSPDQAKMLHMNADKTGLLVG